MLQVNYQGVFSASLNGSTEVSVANDGTVLVGRTINQLSIGAWAFVPGQDRFLGAQCNSSASAEIRWLQKYDCTTDTTYFIPLSGGKASITGGPINNVVLACDPNIVSESFSASAQSGPATPYITGQRRDGFNLIYTGHPISIDSAYPNSYEILLGSNILTAYLQNFSLTVSPPQPSTVSYNFIVLGTV
jgi:hypothetical protein